MSRTAHDVGRTLGVEEELHVADAATGRLLSSAPVVLAELEAAATDLAAAGTTVSELTLSQVETVTGVATSTADVLQRALTLRAGAAAAAERHGLALLASGTPVLGDAAEQQVADAERYDRLRARGAGLVTQQLIAGLHLHLGVGDPSGADLVDDDVRVAAVDGLRPWLPALLAITANSPFWLGSDTGFASYRQIHWQRWPVVGPPPRTRDTRGWQEAVAGLVATEVVDDASYVYWDVRLSTRFPTVEVRVADVPATVDDAALFVGLVRALAVRAVDDHAAGREVLDPPQHVLRAAMWQGARYGLEGGLLDPTSARTVAAADVVDALVRHAEPGLERTGDSDLVRQGLHRLRRDGNGAMRQRRAFARAGWPGVLDVVRVDPHAELARPTTGDGNGWVQCACGGKHWGRNGAAGLLARRPGERGPQVLLQLRAPWTHEGGTWGLPGGARDSHESVVEAATREAREETCLDSSGLVEVARHVDDHGSWSYTYVVVDAPAGTSATVANPESDAVEWVDLDHVERLPLHPALAVRWPVLRGLLERG
ncbi:MAG: glutamate--cysteine ligase [Angustibacter sp.]